jgi:hypothetical protein
MPVKEKDFDVNSLWPPSNHHWMAPGAVKSTAKRFGSGLDVGALRVNAAGFWEILGVSGGNIWSLFEPSDHNHLYYASGFRRYGPGWAYGPAHNGHQEVLTYFGEVYGRAPSQMEQLDHEHDKTLWQSLVAEYQRRIGFTPGRPPAPPPTPPPGPSFPPPVPPVDPPPPVAPPAPPVEPPSPGPARVTLAHGEMAWNDAGTVRRFKLTEVLQ